MPLITLNRKSVGFWNCQKISRIAAGGDVADLMRRSRCRRRGRRRRSPPMYMNGSTSQAASRRVAQRNVIELIAHHLERVDLLGDAHRAELGHDPGADLRGHHVAEHDRHGLAQVAPRGEHARVGRRAGRLVEVGGLDPARAQADDEHQAPDDERRVDDQDARLAQRLAEEAETRAGSRRRGRCCP